MRLCPVLVKGIVKCLWNELMNIEVLFRQTKKFSKVKGFWCFANAYLLFNKGEKSGNFI